MLSHIDVCLIKRYAKTQPVLYDIRKCMYQHMVRISNHLECYKGFIASMPLVSYAGHLKQVAKQLLQQHAPLYFSHATQTTSQQQH